jgi:hypothetical protein
LGQGLIVSEFEKVKLAAPITRQVVSTARLSGAAGRLVESASSCCEKAAQEEAQSQKRNNIFFISFQRFDF